MKHRFVFDKTTGTVVKSDEQPVQNNESVKPVPNQATVVKPEKPQSISLSNGPGIVKLRRSDAPSLVQLVNDKGLPEAYLESADGGVVMFRERQDYSVYQIADQKTGTALAFFGGYALEINFNMEELNSMERIEQCLEGIKKLFRSMIMKQPIR